VREVLEKLDPRLKPEPRPAPKPFVPSMVLNKGKMLIPALSL
jgi:hypothetical protein